MRSVIKNKKGAETTIGTIVIIILAVVVLVFVIAGFTMGWNTLIGKIRSFFGAGGETVDAAILSCNTKCTVTQQEYSYCCEKIKVRGLELNPSDVGEYTCKDLKQNTRVGSSINCEDSFCAQKFPQC
jgi:hypothetical protein